jgi:hypothetical protein
MLCCPPTLQTMVHFFSMNAARVPVEALRVAMTAAPAMDLEAKDAHHLTAMNHLCYYDDSPDMIQMLLAAGVKVPYKTEVRPGAQRTPSRD